MRALADLLETDDPAWPEIEQAVASAPYPVEVLDADPRKAADELLKVQVTTRSWLGAVVHRTGGIVIDHGWLRILGSGAEERGLAALSSVNEHVAAGLIVAQDVLGGQFAWTTEGIRYFAPDSLEWEDLDVGYQGWLAAVLDGGLTGFYEGLRWPGWAAEAAACRLDQAIHVLPPLWTREGKDITRSSRRPMAMLELMSLTLR